MTATAIEWTDYSWNPIRARNLATGKIGWYCEHATPGCANCYAEGMNHRLGTGLPFKPGHRKDVDIFLDEKMLLAPLRWKKPRMIFVCSMTDLFADFTPDEMIDRVFAVMALCPQHTFQVLTKRAARMREYMSGPGSSCEGADRATDITAQMFAIDDILSAGKSEHAFTDLECLRLNDNRPLPNVWLGVSAEDQQRADERIPLLLQTPAAVRFISAEPLLGGVNLGGYLNAFECHDCFRGCTRVSGHFFDEACPSCGGTGCERPRLDWVIVGGESGPHARPMHPGWARSLRDQCAAAGVAFFMKQWGEWAPHHVRAGGDLGGDVRSGREPMLRFSIATGGRSTIPGSRYMERVGKKAAGRLLDGREHSGMPERSA